MHSQKELKAKGKSSRRASTQHVRSAYQREGTSLCPVYTHGSPSVAPCSTVLLPCGEGASILRWSASKWLHSPWDITSEDSAVAVALSPTGDLGAIVGRSGFLDLVEFDCVQTPQLRKRFRPFERSLAAIAEFDTSGGLLALATRDGHIRVYDVDTTDCTHVFRSPNAPLSSIAFHPTPERRLLFVGTEDGTVHMFDLGRRNRTPKVSVQHHVGSVGAFCFVNKGKTIVTASRDKTLCAMHVKDLQRIRLIATNEILAGVCSIGEDGSYVMSTSEGGAIRTFDIETGTEKLNEKTQLPLVRTNVRNGNADDDDEEEEIAVVRARIWDDSGDYGMKMLISLSDMTLLIVRTRKSSPSMVERLYCGNLQELYDIAPIPLRGPSTTHKSEFAVASNTSTLWIMRPPSTDGEGETWSCVAGLRGHGGVVLSIDSITSKKALGGEGSLSSAYLASASRDTTARVWRRSRATGNWSCIAVAKGHAEAVGGVALSQRTGKGLFYVVTAAADRTLKLWSLDRAVQNADKAEGKVAEENISEGFSFSQDHSSNPTAKWTVLAHDKDINAVAVSPDAQLIASGSQDKTLKLWDSQKGKLRAVCRGHRRGLWDVTFSNVDRIVASSSGDATVRIWNIQNGSCLHTLEGHLSGVLKAVFITRGTQIASSGADGLLKIWQAASGECSTTVDAHEDRVWALTAIDDGQKLLSGAADGVLSSWDDVTIRKAKEAAAEKDQQALMAQEVSNAIYGRRWAVAARGALKLGMPQKLKAVIEGLITSAEDADVELTNMVRSLAEDDRTSADGDSTTVEGDELDISEVKEKKQNKLITQLCIYCRDWNASGGPRSAALAARMMQAVFRMWKPSELSNMMTTDKRALIEALIAHGGRHYDRVSSLGTKVFFIEHVLESMKALPEVTVATEKRKRRKSKENDNAVKTLKRRKKGRDVEY